jgi:hypothetical protein
VVHYAYLALNGISVTGNSFADVLLPERTVYLICGLVESSHHCFVSLEHINNW